MISFSSSTDEIHSPPDLITSLARSVMRTYPRASIEAMSPVRSQPSWNLSRGVVSVVGGRDPRAAHLQLARGLAVPFDLAAVVGDYPGLHQGVHAAGADAVVPCLLVVGILGGRAMVPTGLISVMPHACST